MIFSQWLSSKTEISRKVDSNIKNALWFGFILYCLVISQQMFQELIWKYSKKLLSKLHNLNWQGCQIGRSEIWTW